MIVEMGRVNLRLHIILSTYAVKGEFVLCYSLGGSLGDCAVRSPLLGTPLCSLAAYFLSRIVAFVMSGLAQKPTLNTQPKVR